MIRRATFVLVVAASTIAFAEQPAKPIGIGDKVPDFTVTALNGKQYKFSELQKNKNLSASGVMMTLNASGARCA